METYKDHDLPPILTPEEARKFMRLGSTAFYTALRTGSIPCAVRIGRLWRIPRDPLLQWLAQEKAADEAPSQSGD